MNKEPLSLEHREEVMNALANMSGFFSEYSFTNLYLFRSVHRYNLVRDKGNIFIEGFTRDGECYVMPLFDITKISSEEREKLVDWCGTLFPAKEEHIPLFCDECYESMYNLADSDYLYTVEKMAHYPGRYLHKKRNLLKQFLENYEWRAEELTSQNAHHAHTILDIWQEGTSLPKEGTDYFSCKEALDHIEEFGQNGILVFVDNEPAGFLLGENLSQQSYALHFAKGNKKYKGLYQFLFNHFAQSLEGKCSWINMEQDLGIPELRQSKESYFPDTMAHKYRIRIKGKKECGKQQGSQS